MGQSSPWKHGIGILGAGDAAFSSRRACFSGGWGTFSGAFLGLLGVGGAVGLEVEAIAVAGWRRRHLGSAHMPPCCLHFQVRVLACLEVHSYTLHTLYCGHMGTGCMQ